MILSIYRFAGNLLNIPVLYCTAEGGAVLTYDHCYAWAKRESFNLITTSLPAGFLPGWSVTVSFLLNPSMAIPPFLSGTSMADRRARFCNEITQPKRIAQPRILVYDDEKRKDVRL